MVGETVNILGINYRISEKITNTDNSIILKIEPFISLSGHKLEYEIKVITSNISENNYSVKEQSDIVLNWIVKVATYSGCPVKQYIELNKTNVHKQFRSLINHQDIGWHEIMSTIWFMFNDRFWIKHAFKYLETWGNDDALKFRKIQSQMTRTIHDIELKPIKDSDNDNFVLIT